MGFLTTLAFSEDDRTLISVSTDNKNFKILIWDVVTMKEVWQMPVLGERLVAAAISPDGRTVAVGIASGMVRVWNVKSKRELRDSSDDRSFAK